MSTKLPVPRLTRIYRLEATLGPPLDIGALAQGRRRTAPLTGGTFTGLTLNGKLIPGASADWQIITGDGTALGDIRYTLQTDGGELLYLKSRGVRHGVPQSSTDSAAARTSTLTSTCSEPRPKLRPPPLTSTG
jgi:hypothetical protein